MWTTAHNNFLSLTLQRRAQVPILREAIRAPTDAKKMGRKTLYFKYLDRNVQVQMSGEA